MVVEQYDNNIVIDAEENVDNIVVSIEQKADSIVVDAEEQPGNIVIDKMTVVRSLVKKIYENEVQPDDMMCYAVLNVVL